MYMCEDKKKTSSIRTRKSPFPVQKNLLFNNNFTVVQRNIGDKGEKGSLVVHKDGDKGVVKDIIKIADKTSYEICIKNDTFESPLFDVTRSVESTDEDWNLEEVPKMDILDQCVLADDEDSEAYDSETVEDTEDFGETEDFVLKRTKGHKLTVKKYKPWFAEKFIARRTRKMRRKRDSIDKAPIVINYGDIYFESAPSTLRKDHCAYLLKKTGDGSFMRDGKGKTYAELGEMLDDDCDRIDCRPKELKSCIKLVLRDRKQGNFQNIKKKYPKIDENIYRHVAETAFILRHDQGRASQARGVIDEQVFSTDNNFKETFGKIGSKEKPIYIGAKTAKKHGKGGVRELVESDKNKYLTKKRTRSVREQEEVENKKKFKAE